MRKGPYIGIQEKLDSGRMVWTFGLWTPGLSDCGCLDSEWLDAWILDAWTMDNVTLELWTLGLGPLTFSRNFNLWGFKYCKFVKLNSRNFT